MLLCVHICSGILVSLFLLNSRISSFSIARHISKSMKVISLLSRCMILKHFQFGTSMQILCILNRHLHQDQSNSPVNIATWELAKYLKISAVDKVIISFGGVSSLLLLIVRRFKFDLGRCPISMGSRAILFSFRYKTVRLVMVPIIDGISFNLL